MPRSTRSCSGGNSAGMSSARARNAGFAPPKLVISPSPYRSFVGRLLRHVAEIETQQPGRPLAVVIPEVVEEYWWDYLLLNNFEPDSCVRPARPESRSFKSIGTP